MLRHVLKQRIREEMPHERDGLARTQDHRLGMQWRIVCRGKREETRTLVGVVCGALGERGIRAEMVEDERVGCNGDGLRGEGLEGGMKEDTL